MIAKKVELWYSRCDTAQFFGNQAEKVFTMSDMAQIDRNFAVESTLGKENIRFYSVDETPFCVYGSSIT